MKSEADIIYNHIVPSQNNEIISIDIDAENIIKRYLDFEERNSIEDVERYEKLRFIYIREIKKKEKELGLSYRVWSTELLKEFEYNIVKDNLLLLSNK